MVFGVVDAKAAFIHGLETRFSEPLKRIGALIEAAANSGLSHLKIESSDTIPVGSIQALSYFGYRVFRHTEGIGEGETFSNTFTVSWAASLT